MEIGMMAVLVIALGQLLRVMRKDYILNHRRLTKHKNLALVLTILSNAAGWAIVAFGRLMLYLSFLSMHGNIFMIGLVGVTELTASIYIDIKIDVGRSLILIFLDLCVVALAIYYIVELLSLEGMFFII